MSQNPVITLDQLAAGEKLPQRYRVRLEIAPEIIATVRYPAYAAVEAFDKAGWQGEEDKRPAYQIARERAEAVTDVPEGFDWSNALQPALYAINEHFGFFTRPNVPPSSASTD